MHWNLDQILCMKHMAIRSNILGYSIAILELHLPLAVAYVISPGRGTMSQQSFRPTGKEMVQTYQG